MDKDHFEQLCQKAEMSPLGKYSTPYGDVLVAESFRNDNPSYPMGYYKTMWAVERSEMDIGRHLEFDAFHDPEIAFPEKRRARISATVKDAMGWMSVNKDAERYGS